MNNADAFESDYQTATKVEKENGNKIPDKHTFFLGWVYGRAHRNIELIAKRPKARKKK